MNRIEGSRLILWMSVVFGILAALIASLYYRSFAFPSDNLAKVFVLLAFLGHFICFAFLASLPIHLVNLLLPCRRLIFSISALVFAAFIGAVIFDVQLFTLYKFHINAMVWGLVTGGAAGDIFEFSNQDYFYAALFVAFVISTALLGLYLAERITQRKGNRGWLFFLLIIVIMGAGQGIYAWSDARLYQPVMRQLAVIPWAQPLTARRFFQKYSLVDTSDVGVTVDAAVEGIFNYPKQADFCKKETGIRKNLLIIMVDALRFDAMTADVMPNTYAVASSGSQFLNHYSTGNATRFGFFGLFYGVFSSYWKTALNEGVPSILIDSLDKNNYQFGVFASAALTSPEFDRTVFSSVKDKIDLRTVGANKVARDLEITRKFKQFLEQRDRSQPFFSLLFYDAAHGYAMPSDFELKFKPSLQSVSYASLDNDSDPLEFFNRYKNSLNFIDTLIGESIQNLRDSGEYDDTIIVLTSDHGQEFNETKSNSWGHNSNFFAWQSKVPMVIVYPNKKAKTYRHLTSHVDLVPTLMRDVLGCEGGFDKYSNGWPLDLQKSHPLLLINSWSKMAAYDGDRTTVFYQTGMIEVYDSKYQRLDSARAKQADVLKVIELNSDFLD
ncbi:MAG: hypothetical protein OFPII_31990 [Osedax symbiont Rs1]|nr:MAG: hypothetical protein OFPII_31990 [Osedax symbiont Rs1]